MAAFKTLPSPALQRASPSSGLVLPSSQRNQLHLQRNSSAPKRVQQQLRQFRAGVTSAVTPAASTTPEIAEWNAQGRLSRAAHLEEQALKALRHVIDGDFVFPAFPCALIAGDVVLLHLLHRLGALQSGRVKVIFIDTFHLFPETYAFLEDCQQRYGFKAEVFQAAGFTSKEEYQAVHGSDLYIVDIDEYDKICKVEPFGRALKELQVDAMINGRRRDHGADRAHLELFEGPKEGDALVKVQPLAYWEFRDCFEYLERYGVPKHPLHDQGFPSIGDIQTTLPVPKEKWFEYGGERSGRFQGLKNKDGSDKTECGIHVGDAREVPATEWSAPASSITPPSSSLTPPSSTLVPPPSSSLR